MSSHVNKLLTILSCCLYLSILFLIGGCGSDNPTESVKRSPVPVNLTEPIELSSSESLFLTAEIVNPFTENQILKVVLPDSSILYRDLNSNEVWKEVYADSKYAESKSLSASDLDLLLSLDLDTGWKGPSQFQVRFILKASNGKLKASLNGDMTLTGGFKPGDSLQGSFGVSGTEDGGVFSIEGGMEISARYKIDVKVWDHTGNIPALPNVDWGVFGSTTFTPFMFGDYVQCDDDIDDNDVTFPIAGVPDYLSLNVGAVIGGEAQSTFHSDSLHCVLNDQLLSICSEDDCDSFKFDTQADSTTVNPSFTYASRGHVKWTMHIKPAGQARVKIPYIYDHTFTLTVADIPLTIYNQNVSMHFNKVEPDFVVRGTK